MTSDDLLPIEEIDRYPGSRHDLEQCVFEALVFCDCETDADCRAIAPQVVRDLGVTYHIRCTVDDVIAVMDAFSGREEASSWTLSAYWDEPLPETFADSLRYRPETKGERA